MQNVKVTTFNVEQGLFNLVTGTKEDGSPYCGVFDCGNFKNFKGLNCIFDKVVEVLKEYTIIDDVVISHQDTDHWRLFLRLMKSLNNDKGKGKDEEEKWYKDNKGVFYRFVSIKSFESIFFGENTANYYFFLAKKYYYIKAEHAVSQDGKYSNFFIKICNEMASTVLLIEIHKDSQQNNSQYCIRVYNNITDAYRKHEKYSSEKSMLKDILDLVELTFKGDIYDYTEIFMLIGETIKICSCSYVKYCDKLKESVIENVTKMIRNLFLGGDHWSLAYMSFIVAVRVFADGEPTIRFHYPYVDINVDKDFREKKEINHEKDIIGAHNKCELNDDDIKKNVTSQITSLKITDKDFILFPGDVTVHAFSSITETLKIGGKLQLFIAPHHGSYHTNFAFQVGEKEYPVYSVKQPLKELLNTFPPNTIHISANRSKYGHPSESFVKLCGNYCSGAVTEHEVVYCLDGTTDDGSLKTTKAIYTTEKSGNLIFSYPPPPSPPPMIDNAKASSNPIQLPDSDLFIPYGGFNL